jgi:hypothetical protein
MQLKRVRRIFHRHALCWLANALLVLAARVARMEAPTKMPSGVKQRPASGRQACSRQAARDVIHA